MGVKKMANGRGYSVQDEIALRNDPLGEMLVEAFAEKGFEGSAADMLEALKAWCPGWDVGGNWTLPRFGKALKRLERPLEGFFGATRSDHSGRTHYRFKPVAADWGRSPRVADLLRRIKALEQERAEAVGHACAAADGEIKANLENERLREVVRRMAKLI